MTTPPDTPTEGYCILYATIKVPGSVDCGGYCSTDLTHSHHCSLRQPQAFTRATALHDKLQTNQPVCILDWSRSSKFNLNKELTLDYCAKNARQA